LVFAQPAAEPVGGAVLTAARLELIRHYRAIERTALSATASHQGAAGDFPAPNERNNALPRLFGEDPSWQDKVRKGQCRVLLSQGRIHAACA